MREGKHQQKTRAKKRQKTTIITPSWMFTYLVRYVMQHSKSNVDKRLLSYLFGRRVISLAPPLVTKAALQQ